MEKAHYVNSVPQSVDKVHGDAVDFSICKRLKVCICKTLKPPFGIIEVSKTGGILL